LIFLDKEIRLDELIITSKEKKETRHISPSSRVLYSPTLLHARLLVAEDVGAASRSPYLSSSSTPLSQSHFCLSQEYNTHSAKEEEEALPWLSPWHHKDYIFSTFLITQDTIYIQSLGTSATTST
jgi:hypothetical protein